jgi:hypothetical protein
MASRRLSDAAMLRRLRRYLEQPWKADLRDVRVCIDELRRRERERRKHAKAK